MAQNVTPKTYIVGYPTLDLDGLQQYLHDTGNEEFVESIESAKEFGVSSGEILCSMYAKLCYKALTVGQNNNVTRVRDIPSNIEGCFAHGHGSVFEHANINFVTTNCSRVFTHELVRHRAGMAFSQTSGRYVRSDELEVVLGDPILAKYGVDAKLLGLADIIESSYNAISSEIPWDEMPFDEKKKLTSALRRILPNGQGNEIGWSANIRALRHTVMMRTSSHAEWEIRYIFNEVYKLVKSKFPLVFHGAIETEVDGLLEITGMKLQPYQNDELPK